MWHQRAEMLRDAALCTICSVKGNPEMDAGNDACFESLAVSVWPNAYHSLHLTTLQWKCDLYLTVFLSVLFLRIACIGMQQYFTDDKLFCLILYQTHGGFARVFVCVYVCICIYLLKDLHIQFSSVLSLCREGWHALCDVEGRLCRGICVGNPSNQIMGIVLTPPWKFFLKYICW